MNKTSDHVSIHAYPRVSQEAFHEQGRMYAFLELAELQAKLKKNKQDFLKSADQTRLLCSTKYFWATLLLISVLIITFSCMCEFF